MAIQLWQNRKYSEFLAPLDKKQYFFKPILGGLWVVDRLNLNGSDAISAAASR